MSKTEDVFLGDTDSEEEVTDPTAAAERNALAEAYFEELRAMATHAIEVEDLAPTEFIMVCLKVTPLLRPQVDALLETNPEDWRVRFEEEPEAVLRGCMTQEECGYLCLDLPTILEIIGEPPTEGTVHALVLTEEGATGYTMELPSYKPPTLNELRNRPLARVGFS